MIGKLYGTIDEIESNSLILKTTGGVGYKVILSESLLSKLSLNQEVVLHIYTHVRENEISLFGFKNKNEILIFNLLIGVSGVGPKTAMNIMSNGTIDNLILAVKSQNVSFFSGISGIGKKTAQKILLELSSKFDTEFSLSKTIFNKEDELALQGLISLGFNKSEASEAISKVEHTGMAEDRITAALKLLNK